MDLGEQQLMLAVIMKLFTDANNLGTPVFFLKLQKRALYTRFLSAATETVLFNCSEM